VDPPRPQRHGGLRSDGRRERQVVSTVERAARAALQVTGVLTILERGNEIAQQRYKHNAWRTPEVEGTSHDSTIDTTMMEIGQILAFGVPGEANLEEIPRDELRTRTTGGA
jgi:hypothetical protein